MAAVKERVVQVAQEFGWLADADVGFTAEDVAMALVDEDVANGEYDGCSSELELAFLEYRTLAYELFL